MLRTTTSLAAIVVAAGLAASARAATIHLTRTDDPSSGGTRCSTLLLVNTDCSLRNALKAGRPVSRRAGGLAADQLLTTSRFRAPARGSQRSSGRAGSAGSCTSAPPTRR